MRIHLGHHFYGAGNLGDDFMLAGFLAAARTLAPDASFTSCVPFELEPLRRRFPEVDWRTYTDAERANCISEADAWIGLGGSPFQSAHSRWFIDHLTGDAAFCAKARVPMFYLGVGMQAEAELRVPEIRRLCAQATAIHTRDAASAERLESLGSGADIHATADVAHFYFAQNPPPPAARGRVALVPNFDFAEWPGAANCVDAVEQLKPDDRVWLAQESRALPGAEKDLYAKAPAQVRSKWRLVEPEQPGNPLNEVLARWPSGEWLVTARYHAAIAGSWAGSRIVVIRTNEKLRSVATDFGLPTISPEATSEQVADALAEAARPPLPTAFAERARASCAAVFAAITRA